MSFRRSVYWERRRGLEDIFDDVDLELQDLPEPSIVIDREQSDANRDEAIRRITSGASEEWIERGVGIALSVGAQRNFSTDDIWPELGPPPEGRNKKIMTTVVSRLRRCGWARVAGTGRTASVTRNSGLNTVWELTGLGRAEEARRRR